MAPDPGHHLATSDDAHALALALAGQHPDVRVRPGDGSLTVHGAPSAVASYVRSVVRADVDLIEFTPTETPLEALFFMLTDESPTDATAATGAALAGASR
jgi:ABC-2 type transport system ATP-binding protein